MPRGRHACPPIDNLCAIAVVPGITPRSVPPPHIRSFRRQRVKRHADYGRSVACTNCSIVKNDQHQRHCWRGSANSFPPLANLSGPLLTPPPDHDPAAADAPHSAPAMPATAGGHSSVTGSAKCCQFGPGFPVPFQAVSISTSVP
jgi:hypothetical protein